MILLTPGLELRLKVLGFRMEAIEELMGVDSLLRVYSGEVPRRAEHALAPDNLLLVEAPYSSGTRVQGLASATGKAAFFRLVQSSDTDEETVDGLRLQGEVGDLAGRADLRMSSPYLVYGIQLTVENFGYP